MKPNEVGELPTCDRCGKQDMCYLSNIGNDIRIDSCPDCHRGLLHYAAIAVETWKLPASDNGSDNGADMPEPFV